MAGLTPLASEAECVFGLEAGPNKDKTNLETVTCSNGASPSNPCPQCGSKKLFKDGLRYTADNSSVQRWLCRDCGYRFSEKPLQKTPEWSINTPAALPSKRQICAIQKGAKNLVTQTEIKTVCAGIENLQQDLKGKVAYFIATAQTKGFAECTIESTINDLLRLNKTADLNDPVKVWFCIENHTDWKMGTRQHHASSYVRFAKIVKIHMPEDLNFIKWFLRGRLPKYIPTEIEIAQLIAQWNRKNATLLQMLYETGMRSGEAWRLRWDNIDFERKTLTLNAEDCEKDGLARQFKISDKLISMLHLLKATSKRETIWAADRKSLNSLRIMFVAQRKRLAAKTGNNNFNKISLHTLRHFYACKLYHDTNKLELVREKLGHKSIESTMIYTRIVEWEKNDQWIVCRPQTTQEEDHLIETGFEYVRFDERLQQPIYRKRK
jgi:integrase/recombinase XerD